MSHPKASHAAWSAAASSLQMRSALPEVDPPHSPFFLLHDRIHACSLPGFGPLLYAAGLLIRCVHYRMALQTAMVCTVWTRLCCQGPCLRRRSKWSASRRSSGPWLPWRCAPVKAFTCLSGTCNPEGLACGHASFSGGCQHQISEHPAAEEQGPFREAPVSSELLAMSRKAGTTARHAPVSNPGVSTMHFGCNTWRKTDCKLVSCRRQCTRPGPGRAASGASRRAPAMRPPGALRALPSASVRTRASSLACGPSGVWPHTPLYSSMGRRSLHSLGLGLRAWCQECSSAGTGRPAICQA